MKTHMLIKHLESAVFCCNACGTMFKTSEGSEKHDKKGGQNILGVISVPGYN